MSRQLSIAALGLALSVCAVCVLAGCAGGSSGVSEESGADGGRTEEWVVAVGGMTCQGCVNTVTGALKALPGVQSVEVSLENEQAVVSGISTQVTPAAIVAAIEKAGYEATLAEEGEASAEGP